jgi:FkbM family methyltransferase
MELDDFIGAAKEFLRETILTNSCDESGKRWLAIPGHQAGVIRAMKVHRDPLEIRLKKRPNTEFYEQAATLLFAFLLDRLQSRTVLDVGASSGYFGLLAASRLEHPPKVHSFEMQPVLVDTARETAKRARLDDQLTSNLAGLTDHHIGEKKIWYARTLLFEEEPARRDYEEAWYIRLKFFLQGRNYQRTRGLKSARVSLTSLDHYCQQFDVRPDLMKVDVDGYEGKVLAGGARMFAECMPTILLELHADRKQRDGFTRRSLVAPLLDLGYLALFITDHHDPRHCDLVAVDRGHALWDRDATDMVLFVSPRKLDELVVGDR